MLGGACRWIGCTRSCGVTENPAVKIELFKSNVARHVVDYVFYANAKNGMRSVGQTVGRGSTGKGIDLLIDLFSISNIV